jgi:peroxiredoxin
LSDPNLTTAQNSAFVYQDAERDDELYTIARLGLSPKHNEMERPELPLSATYIVNRKGEIVYAFLEPDYKQRAAPETIIETLLKIKSPPVKKQ